MQISEETTYRWCISVLVYGYILIKGCVAGTTLIHVDLSGTVLLKCTKPEQELVIWMHNDKVISYGSTIIKSDSDRFHISTKYQNDRSLIISSIKNTDEGQYKCQTRTDIIETYMVVIQDTQEESRTSTLHSMDPELQTISSHSSHGIGNLTTTRANKKTLSVLTMSSTETATSHSSSSSPPQTEGIATVTSLLNRSKSTTLTTGINQITISNVDTKTTESRTSYSSTSSDANRQRNASVKHENCFLKIVLVVLIIKKNLF